LAGFLLDIRKQRVCDSVADLDLIFIDEVSMMRKYQLAQLDKRLRVAKRVSDVPFGGVHIVLVGDFLQLPPVGGEPIYKDPSQKANVSPHELAGYRLWRAFGDVVILKAFDFKETLSGVAVASSPAWAYGHPSSSDLSIHASSQVKALLRNR
jgi:hypothetical protein